MQSERDPVAIAAQQLADKRDKLSFYRGETMHEWTLLSARVSTLITSQSFLVSAYTISLSNTNPNWGERFTLYYPLLLSVVGLSITLYSYPAITAAIRVIELWHKKQGRLFLLNPDEAERNPEIAQSDPAMEDYRDGRPLVLSPRTGQVPVDPIQARSLRYARITPLIFGITWIALAALVVVLQVIH